MARCRYSTEFQPTTKRYAKLVFFFLFFIYIYFYLLPLSVVSDSSSSRAVRPEIEHQFRQPEKRPARFVSDLFTGLCIAPLLVLFALWSKLKVNVSNFPISISALGFHAGFGAILSLFGVFFWKLNMFETIRYLLPLALVTFICGNRLLRSIAAGGK